MMVLVGVLLAILVLQAWAHRRQLDTVLYVAAQERERLLAYVTVPELAPFLNEDEGDSNDDGVVLPEGYIE